MKIVLMMLTIAAALAFTTTDHLSGRWESKSSVNGHTTGILFKADTSFEAYIDRKPFVSGTYTFKDNIFSFVDNGCNGARGVYKIIFFSNADSMRFQAISDSCIERKGGMERLTLGKVK